MTTDRDLIITLKCINSEKSQFLLTRLSETERIVQYIENYKLSNPKFIANIHIRAKELIDEFRADTDNTFTEYTKTNYIEHLKSAVGYLSKDYYIHTQTVSIRKMYAWIYFMHHAWLKAKVRRRSQKAYWAFLQKAEDDCVCGGITEQTATSYINQFDHAFIQTVHKEREKWNEDYNKLTNIAFIIGMKGKYIRNKFQTQPVGEIEKKQLVMFAYLFSRKHDNEILALRKKYSLLRFPAFGTKYEITHNHYAR